MTHGHGRSGLVARLGDIALIGLALAANGLLTGCARDVGSQSQIEPAGSIGLSLTAAPGVTLNSVTYTITGSTFSRAGAIDTSGSPTISGTIGGIPAAKGYTITLTATSVESDTTFTGSAKFDVTAGATTSVLVHLNGVTKKGNGSVVVNGTINVNPRIDGVTVSPLTVFVGGAITLSATGSDADGGPAPLSYYWSTTGGLIDNPIGPNATLSSATPGTFTVTLTLSDGDGTDTAATIVTFVKPSTAAGGAGGGGRAAGGGGGGGGGRARGASQPQPLLDHAD